MKLLVGMQIVMVMDVKGCMFFILVEMVEDILLFQVFLFMVQFVICVGVIDGVFIVLVKGGKGLFVYVWSGGQCKENIDGFQVGNYFFIVMDLKGISVQVIFVFIEFNLVQVIVIVIQFVSINNVDGMVWASVIGGMFFYVYVWSIGFIIEVVEFFFFVDYKVIIMDVNGCIVIVMVGINENIFFLQVFLREVGIVNCNGVVIGVIVSEVIGGKFLFNYVWSGGQDGLEVS